MPFPAPSSLTGAESLQLECLSFTFKLDGCRSLKEKRQRLSGIRDRFGKRPEVAVIESNHADSHDIAEWSFIIVAATKSQLDSLLQKIEMDIAASFDARITDVSRRPL